MESLGPISPSQIPIHQNSLDNIPPPEENMLDDQINQGDHREPQPQNALNFYNTVDTWKIKKQNFFFTIALCTTFFTLTINAFLICWMINYLFFGYWRRSTYLKRLIGQIGNFALYLWGYFIWSESTGWYSFTITIFLILYLREFLDHCSTLIVTVCALCCCVGIFGIIFGFVRPMVQQQQQLKKKKRDEYIKKMQQRQANQESNQLNPVELQCSICLLNQTDPYKCLSTECSHSFHFDCLKLWLNEHNTCPICRKALY